MLHLTLLALHVAANLVWIGSILAVAWLARQPAASSVALARSFYKQYANPAFIVSFTCGLVMVLLNSANYLKAHWFHGKLTLAIAIIGLHHVIGAKVRRAAEAEHKEPQALTSLSTLGALLAAGAFLVVVLAVFKGALIP
jgi:protoporphyrinogen IX oxidase